jgi:hypothetical protein
MNKNHFFTQIAFNKRFKGFFLTLLMLLSSSIIYAQTIALWTFENSHPSNSGPHSPEVGAGTASGTHIGGSSTTSPVGNGSQHSFREDNWADGDYFQFEVSTLGYGDVTFSFNQASSGTGPESFEIQVSTDGINFTTISNYNVTNITWNASGPNAGSSYSFNLPGTADQSTLIIRLAVADGSTAVNGGAIGNSGTSRIDNVSITGSQPLPVTMSSFSGATQNGKNILTWEVQLEQNISHYEVESSNDGHEFHTIGKVIALNRSGSTTYSFTDEANDGTTYYRLKVMDAEAGHTFSRTLSIEGVRANFEVSLEANPVYGMLPITISGENNVSLEIFDIGGRRMFAKSYTSNGNTALNLDISGFPNGMYFLKASSAGLLKTLRFVKH